MYLKSIKLNDDNVVVGAFVVSDLKEYLCIFTDRNTTKRLHISDLDKTTRAKKGSLIIKSPKSKKYNIIKAFNIGSRNIFGVMDKEIGYIKSSDINIFDKVSTGTTFTKKNVEDIFIVAKYTDITNQNKTVSEPSQIANIIEENEIENEEIAPQNNMEEKKERQLTMSDFFEEFKI